MHTRSFNVIHRKGRYGDTVTDWTPFAPTFGTAGIITGSANDGFLEVSFFDGRTGKVHYRHCAIGDNSHARLGDDS